LQQIKKFDLFYEKKLNILEKSKIEELENLEVIPLKYKLKKLKYLMKNSVLNGYKFQFKGRFTRKQKAANM